MHKIGSTGFLIFLSIFISFVIFLYGPIFSIILLSFQGPSGGLTFPLNGFSFYWFGELWRGSGLVDIGASFRRSIGLGIFVMVLTVILSVSAGLAFRKKFLGSDLLFYTTIASLIVPSIVLSLGVALEFRLIDSLLIMFAIFNRFDKSLEEASRDLGANSYQTFWYVVFPIIAPSIVGIALFGFTLSYDELARSSQVMGATNTLPLDLRGLTTTVTTPIIYALGTVTTSISFLVIGFSLTLVYILRHKKIR